MADSTLGAARQASSSADLSSPTKSPESPIEDSIVVSSTPVASSRPQPTSTSSSTQSQAKQEAAEKPKRTRKPKLAADGTEIKPVPRPRAPRTKKKDPTDQNATAATTPSTTTASKTPAVTQTPNQAPVKAPKQSKINELVISANNNAPVQQISSSEQNSKSVPIGKTLEAIPNKPSTPNLSIANSSQPRSDSPQQTSISNRTPIVPASASSRGQAYDPIRSVSSGYDPVRSSTITAPRSVPTSNPSTPGQLSPVKQTVRASTSPSIASLINPPSTSVDPPISRPGSSLSPNNSKPAQTIQPSTTNITTVSTPTIAPVAMPTIKQPTPPIDLTGSDMDIDAKLDVSRKTSISNGSAASPAPSKAREKPLVLTPKLPPLPGQGFNTSKDSGARAIIIQVPLKGESNKYVNFQQLAVKKYGFDAVYPKLAINREHLARVAANAAALERKPGTVTSNDEMSVDGSENEADMSTGSKRKATTDLAEPAKKKRLTYEDLYDRDDPFIDDSEMAWEEQAAAVKDGFFVYSGLLVEPGTDAKVEKADAPKKRSRPAKGTTTKTPAAKITTKDKPDDKKEEGEKKDVKSTATTATATTNGAKPSDAPVKKPAAPRKRYTKAEQEARRIERERIAKEKSDAAAAAAGGASTTATTSNSTKPAALVSHTTTPVVSNALPKTTGPAASTPAIAPAPPSVVAPTSITNGTAKPAQPLA